MGQWEARWVHPHGGWPGLGRHLSTWDSDSVLMEEVMSAVLSGFVLYVGWEMRRKDSPDWRGSAIPPTGEGERADQTQNVRDNALGGLPCLGGINMADSLLALPVIRQDFFFS